MEKFIEERKNEIQELINRIKETHDSKNKIVYAGFLGVTISDDIKWCEATINLLKFFKFDESRDIYNELMECGECHRTDNLTKEKLYELSKYNIWLKDLNMNALLGSDEK